MSMSTIDQSWFIYLNETVLLLNILLAVDILVFLKKMDFCMSAGLQSNLSPI